MFNREHRLTFFARISCGSVPLQRKKTTSLYPSEKVLKHSPFSPPFCAPLAQGAKILTREIWGRPTHAGRIFSGSVKVCRSYSRKVDFERLHIMLSCTCMVAYNERWTVAVIVSCKRRSSQSTSCLPVSNIASLQRLYVPSTAIFWT